MVLRLRESHPRLTSVCPCLGELEAVGTSDIESVSTCLICSNLEARRVDDTVEFIFFTGDNEAFFGDTLDPFTVGIDKRRSGFVVGLKICVVKTWSLANCRYHALRFCAAPSSSTIVSTRLRISCIFSLPEALTPLPFVNTYCD